MHDTFMATLVIIVVDQSLMLCTAMQSLLLKAFLDTKAATIIDSMSKTTVEQSIRPTLILQEFILKRCGR